MEAAHDFAHGREHAATAQPGLGPRASWKSLDTGRLADVDGWSNGWIAHEAGNSAHEIRTWVAAFAALAAQGPYQTRQRFYRAAPELIAGFAVRTAVPTP